MNKGNMWVVIVVVVALIAGGLYYVSTQNAAAPAENENGTATTTSETSMEGSTVPGPGIYTASAAESKIEWAAGKPLIEGYINSGTLALKEGSIEIATSSATGVFTIDMNAIKVGLTAKKPGKEGALETHLKSADFFDVAKYPTASFKITAVTPRADSATTHQYDLTGELTMKGKTNPVTFPALIHMKEGKLHAEAEMEFDRTKWGITYGSGTFFDNLADNAISDMISLKLNIVAAMP